MKKLFTGVLVATMAWGAAPSYAEGGVELEVGADLVSSYVWRGQDCGGFSIQPGATLSWKGFSLGVWASAELLNNESSVANMAEFDLSLAYEIGGLSVGVTDYTYCTGDYLSGWNFSQSSVHQLELNLGYDFGPVAFSWNTVLAGPDRKCYEIVGADGEASEVYYGDRLYSSYVEISAPFKLGGVDCSAAVGAIPWEDAFTAVGNKKFNVVNCSLTAEKELKGIPFMGQVVYNPQSEATFFVVGVSF